ncbi:MAG: hypothetical protein K2L19_00975 [Eubacterium sp.]|nr:hypothetical protein [Eubacterium sp.]
MIKHNQRKVNMRIISIFLAFIIFLEMIPANVVFANDTSSGSVSDSQQTEDIISDAREKAENEVYDALSSAGLEKIPTLEEYYAQNGAPKIISLTEFIADVGVYSSFNASTAGKYNDYKIRIDTADELYQWSQNCNSIIAQEKNFYLSANFILGNNIEYKGGSYSDDDNMSYYRPVGSESAPFNGTFDGQGFEIRMLAFDTYNTPDAPYGYGLFGVIGESATVQNLGLNGVSDMTVDGHAPIAVRLGMIAVINKGTINKVYCDLTEFNGAEYTANCGFAGIAYENQGTISDVYYAGADNAESEESAFLHDPVCAQNSGVIQNAYYDKTVYTQDITGVSSDEASPVTALSTVELKTLGQNNTDDDIEFANDTTEFYHWHIVRKALSSDTIANITSTANINKNFVYPKLYGFTSELRQYSFSYSSTPNNEMELSTPADLVYLPASPEYLVSNNYWRFVFRLTDNIDMSYVADSAYTPSADYFHGHITGKTDDASQYNNSYSIINLCINKPAVYVSGGIKYYYYGLIGRSNPTRVPDSDIVGQNVGPISDINFIGGGITTGDYDFSDGFSSGTFQLYMGMACAFIASAGSVVNISSTADVTYSDESLTIKAKIGGIFGHVFCERLENIVNYGNVYGGTHEYVDGYNGNASTLGGVAGYGTVSGNQPNTARYHMKNVVNYGSVAGIGVYGSLSTDPERMQADHTDNNSTKYVNRARYYYTGGVIGYSETNICIDMIANFGEVFDVPSVKKEVPVYDNQNNQTGTEMRYIGIVPDEDSYILNYEPRLGGITGYVLGSGENNSETYYGFDNATAKFVDDTGFYYRCYNFGGITAAESRCGYIGGVRAFDQTYFSVINNNNFGDITCYSLNYVRGVGKEYTRSTGKMYDSANYGNIYVDNSSRSGRQTHFTNFKSYNLYGVAPGYAVRCSNYGKITYSYGGYIPWSYHVTTMNAAVYADIVFSGVSGVCNSCSNYGDINVNTFDKWTGEYSYVDMTADHFLKSANGQELYTSYTSAHSNQRFRSLYVSGVAGQSSASNCVNYGNITVTGTPEDYDKLAKTYDELVEKLGFSPNAERRQQHQGAASGVINGWETRTVNGVSIAGTGLDSDRTVRNAQRLFSECFVGAISTTSNATYTMSNCVNLGDITITDFANSNAAFGISYCGRISNSVNKGNLTVTANSSSTVTVAGIVRYSDYVSNCMNTGNLTANSLDCAAYVTGIVYELSSTVWNISNCINLGDITVNRVGEQRHRIGAVNTYVSGVLRYLHTAMGGSIYGCSNYGDINIKYDAKRYISDDLDRTCDTARLEFYDETNSTTYLYDRANDDVSAGGVIGSGSNVQGTSAHTCNVNSCINQGDISIDCRQMYATSSVYAGGVVGYYDGAADNSFGGVVNVFSNLVNHGDVTIYTESEPYNNNTAANYRLGGIFGHLISAHPAVGKPAVRFVVENLLNTGSLNGTAKKADGSDVLYRLYIGAMAGILRYGQYNRESNLTIKNVLNYSDNALIGYKQDFTQWYLQSYENGNGVTLSGGNKTYSNRITLENLYSASTEHEIIKIGAVNMKDENGAAVPQRLYSVGVLTTEAEKNGEKVTTDDDDLRTYKYIYPVADENGDEAESAFFTMGSADSDTGVICALGYLDYGALSTAYREKYSNLNGGSYDTSEPEEPEDPESPEYEAYQKWFKQLGGFVLTSAKPGELGNDYFPNQFVPSNVKPNSTADIWYTDDIHTALNTYCAQIDLLDLNDILQFVVTNGTTSTISKRHEKNETENTIYVYVQNEIAEDDLSVLSYQISSGASVVFYRDASHTNEIEDIYNETIVMNREEDAEGNTQYDYQLYARVTAQNGDVADWVIRLQSTSAEPSISLTSAIITNSGAGNNSTVRTYYPSISDEALQSKNLWDYPAYWSTPLMNLNIETKNIEDGYNLYNHMTAYYYIQNAYGITDAGFNNGLGKSTCLADLLEKDSAYTMDENGDIRYNNEIVAELIYNGRDYKLVPETEESFALKAEKYSCVKSEDAPDDYYLNNEGANILWEFVKSDGSTLISRSDEDFFSEENGALKLKYNNKEHFEWATTNTVQTKEEADINGNLLGSYLLYSAGGAYRKGGYFEFEFEFSNGSTDSLYLAYLRGDGLKPNGYSTFNNTTLGNTAVLDNSGQWNVSETVRDQRYDGYGAFSSYGDAAAAIKQAYDDGKEIPYVSYNNLTNYNNGNAPIFPCTSNYSLNYYAGSTNGYWHFSSLYAAGDETTLKSLILRNTTYNAALFRPMIYQVHRNADGSVDYMDIIVQTMSEDLGLTRYYPVKVSYPDSTVDRISVQYKDAADSYYSPADSSTVQIDGEEQTVYEVPKGTESNFSMLSQYSTSPLSTPFSEYNFASGTAKPETQTAYNYDSLFTVEFCPEDGNTFTHIGNATFTSGVGFRLITDKSSPAQVTAIINRASNTTVSMTLNGNATMGYYRITPVFAKTEYFYLYEDAVKFAESLDTGVSITGLDKCYEIVEEKSDRGYPIYKTIMYMAYDSTIIHKRANDDSYLKNIFMSNDIGSTVNLSSINADAIWDSTNPYALAESNQQLEKHKSIDGESNIIRFSDGKIFYNADPLTDDTDTCIENVNSFAVYSYISTNRRINGIQTSISEAYLDMNKDYLPGNSTLYYLNGARLDSEGDIVEGTGEWTQVEFDSNRQVIDSQKEFFRYKNFAGETDVKEAKMFKVVAENGNVSYYTINALQNKRNKSINVRVGDFVRDGITITEKDKGTQENLAALLETYGTFSVSLNCMIDSSSTTIQTGYYNQTGTDGNEFYNLKFGNYDIILNVPESAGYEYEVYYFGSGNKVELERSPDNPNAYRLPLRFKNLIGEGNSIELCVSIKKQSNADWGYMIHKIFQR